MISTLKHLIPSRAANAFRPYYHYLLALLGSVWYRSPSRDLFVVGVTGTKGKSSTVEIINAILEEAGYKTALASTIRFKVDQKSDRNMEKMTMPGRFFLQRFFSQAVQAGCTYAIIEMTSEGAKQYRHAFIDLDALVFLNLSPEHIESHGSFAKYKKAKLSLAHALEKKSSGLLIVNEDDPASQDFLSLAVPLKKTFSPALLDPWKETDNGLCLTLSNETIRTPLRGAFNASNIAAAYAFCATQGVSTKVIGHALEKMTLIPGRVEKIMPMDGQSFDVYVDYAHTPDSLEKLYAAFAGHTKICVLGNTGGGRDTWKRPEMGRIAEKYCDRVILTNEDPYDENPRSIVEDMEKGMREKKPEVLIDRREAIKTALCHARDHADTENVVVLITGKGTDPYIMGPNGTKTPWSDARVVQEELQDIYTKR